MKISFRMNRSRLEQILEINEAATSIEDLIIKVNSRVASNFYRNDLLLFDFDNTGVKTEGEEIKITFVVTTFSKAVFHFIAGKIRELFPA